MEEFFAVIFIECMMENNRCFSEKDFYKLLETQRLDKTKINFNNFLEEFLEECKSSSFDINSYEKIDNIWQPSGTFKSHKSIYNIIDELDLHLEVEFSISSFYDTSFDIVQKINNYIYVSELSNC